MILNDQQFRDKLSISSFLLADNELGFHKTMAEILGQICKFKNSSESLYAVGSAREALKILIQNASKDKPVDMVFIDLRMSDMHGIELLRAVRKSQNSSIQNVPLLVVTAVQDKKILLNTIFEGADGFLVKPFTARELLLKMNSVLRGHWSKIKSNRKQSKRKENRLDTSRLDFVVEVHFEHSTPKKCQVIDMSEHGARIYLNTNKKNIDIDIPEGLVSEEDDKVRSISIPAISSRKDCEFAIDVSSLPNIDLNGLDEVIPLSIADRFSDESTGIVWRDWINLAKRENLEYLDKLKVA